MSLHHYNRLNRCKQFIKLVQQNEQRHHNKLDRCKRQTRQHTTSASHQLCVITPIFCVSNGNSSSSDFWLVVLLITNNTSSCDKQCLPSYSLHNVTFPSVLWHCWLGDRKGIRPVKTRSSADADKPGRRVWRSVKVTKHSTIPYVRYMCMYMCMVSY